MPLIDPDDRELRAIAGRVDFAGRRVVEIGAGDGRLAWPLASGARLWLALDPDAEAVAGAAHEVRAAPPPTPVRLLVADGSALCLPAECCDVALFTWSLC
jgi:predicted RNA methylase